MNEVVK
jgi:hypothetical protein